MMEHALDSMQFADRLHRGAEDANVTILNLLFKHLEGKAYQARILFVDFSSSLDTVQPHMLARHILEQFGLSNNLVGQILYFLSDRTQRVKENGEIFEQVCSSTNCSQGYVLSPLSFILYRNICQGMRENRTIVKCADDCVILQVAVSKIRKPATVWSLRILSVGVTSLACS